MRYMRAYNSPLIVLSSIGLFFLFYRIKINSKIINCLSSSVLAIYLIHIHPCFGEFCFTPIILKAGSNIPLIILIIFFICLFCVLIDKLRGMFIVGVFRMVSSFRQRFYNASTRLNDDV